MIIERSPNIKKNCLHNLVDIHMKNQLFIFATVVIVVDIFTFLMYCLLFYGDQGIHLQAPEIYLTLTGL